MKIEITYNDTSELYNAEIEMKDNVKVIIMDNKLMGLFHQLYNIAYNFRDKIE